MLDGVQRLAAMTYRKDYYGRNCNPYFWFRRGYLWKCEHVRMDFCRYFSAGRYERRRGSGGSPPGALSVPKGEVAVHRGADHVELPRLARPKGCFVTSATWS